MFRRQPEKLNIATDFPVTGRGTEVAASIGTTHVDRGRVNDPLLVCRSFVRRTVVAETIIAHISQPYISCEYANNKSGL